MTYDFWTSSLYDSAKQNENESYDLFTILIPSCYQPDCSINRHLLNDYSWKLKVLKLTKNPIVFILDLV